MDSGDWWINTRRRSELFARQWCDTPEDVVQEAFVKLASAGTPPENPAAWLFRVVRNGRLNAAQAARRRRAARIRSRLQFIRLVPTTRNRGGF